MAPRRQPVSRPASIEEDETEQYGDNRMPPLPLQDQWTNSFTAMRRPLTVNYHDVVALHRPSNYTGLGNPVELTNWIGEMDNIFEKAECPDHERVRIAATYLKDEAQRWWRTIMNDRLNRTGYSWTDLKEDLFARFSPTRLGSMTQGNFPHLTMKDETVDEYYTKFIELSNYLPPEHRDEASLKFSFELGLRPYLRRLVSGLALTTVQETYERASEIHRAYGFVMGQEEAGRGTSSGGENKGKGRAIEGSQNPRDQVTVDPFRGGPHPGNLVGGQWQDRDLPQGRPGQDKGKGKAPQPSTDIAPCFRCNRLHPGRRCNGDPLVCYRCGGTGHKASSCATPRKSQQP